MQNHVTGSGSMMKQAEKIYSGCCLIPEFHYFYNRKIQHDLLNNSPNITLLHAEEDQSEAVKILFDYKPLRSNRLRTNTSVWRSPPVNYRNIFLSTSQPCHFSECLKRMAFIACPDLKRNNPVTLPEPKTSPDNDAMDNPVQRKAVTTWHLISKSINISNLGLLEAQSGTKSMMVITVIKGNLYLNIMTKKEYIFRQIHRYNHIFW